MRVGHGRRGLPGAPAGRRRQFGAGEWPGPSESGRRAQTASKSVSLGLAVALVAALGYALVEFFRMLRVSRIDLSDLWFVPVAMIAVMLVVLLRVVRPLLRGILTKASRR
jgi:hypothetical protein